jgi:hypothetical protein
MFPLVSLGVFVLSFDVGMEFFVGFFGYLPSREGRFEGIRVGWGVLGVLMGSVEAVGVLNQLGFE